MLSSKPYKYGADRRQRQPAMRQHWRERLPAEWQQAVVAPQRFEVHRDQELEAERCFGYDARQVACYYAHHYRIAELRSDDDEEFYVGTLYGESLVAWLLDDGRWLIHRIVLTDEHCEGRAFYSFSPRMPR